MYNGETIKTRNKINNIKRSFFFMSRSYVLGNEWVLIRESIRIMRILYIFFFVFIKTRLNPFNSLFHPYLLATEHIFRKVGVYTPLPTRPRKTLIYDSTLEDHERIQEKRGSSSWRFAHMTITSSGRWRAAGQDARIKAETGGSFSNTFTLSGAWVVRMPGLKWRLCASKRWKGTFGARAKQWVPQVAAHGTVFIIYFNSSAFTIYLICSPLFHIKCESKILINSLLCGEQICNYAQTKMNGNKKKKKNWADRVKNSCSWQFSR